MNVQRGMTLLPAPVSTLHLRVERWHFPISAGILMSAKASVPFVFTSVMVMVSSSHKGWLLQGTTTAPTWFRADAIPVPTWFRTAATLTSSMWGSSSVPTSWILFCLGLVPLSCWGMHCPAAACFLLVVLHLAFQCPILPHAWHWESFAGQEAHPGACCFVQFPQECCCLCCCCWGLCPLHWPFCWGPLWMVWTVLELPSPKASISVLMALWVLHTSNILAVVSLMGRASSFFTNSLSSRAQTKWYCTFCSFLLSIGKLQWSARVHRQSTSSLGVSPGRIGVSSSL